MNKNKKIILCAFIILIIFVLFISFYYKKIKNGNNISKSTDDIVNYILNISSYEANLEVIVESNKTKNQYKLNQLYSKPNIMKQIIQEPNNLENLTILYDGTNMRIENTSLGLSKIYEQYEYISQNSLWLSSLIDNFNEKSKITETENEIIIQNNNIYNDYNVSQILYINKSSSLPTKMEIMDNNKNTKIYIKYNEIKLNHLKQNDIIAFRLEKTNI